ncbi:S8 family serine peptidase [Paenibacillus tarimensis]
MMIKKVLKITFTFILLLGTVLPGISFAQNRDTNKLTDPPTAGESYKKTPDSWILKWRDPKLAADLPGTRVIRRQPDAAVEVIVPLPGTDTEQWLAMLRDLPNVAYVHPNGKVHLLTTSSDSPSESELQPNLQDEPEASASQGPEAASSDVLTLSPSNTVKGPETPRDPALPDDPELSRQKYLDQIGVKKAWETVREQTDITIAVVDTGIDLEHPDLKGNLVPGTNLVEPGKKPQDDNGHGTNVAGVLAAIGNNGKGISGMLWNAKVMPVKALDWEGYGNEDRLGEGILYAVKNNAKMVVLSLGLDRSSQYMLDIVQYAESKGVLVVAATGNEGVQNGSKSAVKYPAGYPSVLAVAGVTPDNKPEPRSNSGTEVDIAAPWHVYTTALGGGYKKEEGTSMAAPQVAAAAALIWAKYPGLKPFQVRALLRQSAKDIGPGGWDRLSGYGLLQVDAALTIQYKPDAAEPNESRSEAFQLPLFSRISGQLNTGKDKDWYMVEVPEDGTLTIRFQGLTSQGIPMPPVKITHYADGKSTESIDVKISSKTLEWKVKKGNNYIELHFDDKEQSGVLSYLITSDFAVNPDAYEPNDRSIEAFTLPPNTRSVTGSFHKTGDRDWYSITFADGGTLKLSMTTDTVRIDPGIAIAKAGEELLEIDENVGGEKEETPLITITPGKYFIRARNAAADEAKAVVGSYTLNLSFEKTFDDPNEPNDKSYEATAIRTDTDYVGVIGKTGDEDWFQLRLTEESLVSLALTDVPDNRTMTLTVYDKTQKQQFSVKSVSGNTSLKTNRKLAPGMYYIQLTANRMFNHQYYIFNVHAEPLVSGFRDIKGHWAQGAIASLADKGIIKGSGEYRFDPEREITRAEAIAILARAFAPPGDGGAIPFKDVPPGHWAWAAIAKGVKAGWITGYPNGTFKPDRPITRAEMAAMLGAALQVKPVTTTVPPFADVNMENWAVPMLAALKQAGWIGGYPGNKFKPENQASRAEFSALVYRALP